MSLFKGLDTPFFDNITGPLAFGFVYFGQPNQNAIANPKVPYADQAFTTPLAATQVLTIAGKFEQEIWLDGDYSVIITDSFGVQQAEYLIVPQSEGGGGEGSLPAGGTTGQVLAKASDTDYDAEWVSRPDRRVVTNITPNSGIVILDYALGDYFILTLTENVTEWIVVNAPPFPVGGNMMVRIIQDSTPRTNVFPSFFHFTEGSTDEVPTGADEVAILALTSFGDGAWDATMANVPQPPDPDAVPGVPSSAIRIDNEALWTIVNWTSPTGWTTDAYAGPYPAKGWGISSAPNSNGPSFSLVPAGGWNVTFRPSKIYVYRWFETGSSIFANRLSVTLNDGSTFVSSTTDSEGALTVDMPGTNSYVTELRFFGINDSGGQSTGLHASVIAYE